MSSEATYLTTLKIELWDVAEPTNAAPRIEASLTEKYTNIMAKVFQTVHVSKMQISYIHLKMQTKQLSLFLYISDYDSSSQIVPHRGEKDYIYENSHTVHTSIIRSNWSELYILILNWSGFSISLLRMYNNKLEVCEPER